MSQFNERLGSFDKTLGFLKEGQDNFNRILSGVKHFGGTSEWSLKAIVAETLPNSFYVENAKLNPETRDFVELAIKLPTNILLPIDSHWSKERYKDVVDAFYESDEEKLKKARKLLADAYRRKAEEVKEKYINPPISTPFALVYVPVSGLYRELEDYTDYTSMDNTFKASFFTEQTLMSGSTVKIKLDEDLFVNEMTIPTIKTITNNKMAIITNRMILPKLL